ncbi:hypothetical protein [Dyadobacter alkalitolerans]|uniref:hypothetical protein n=1 Tax=Dyadobacter alkalitolerans TaxID=492736 RepID=UPI00047E5E41|nr:hypothetical protein [Dyadobacter alkalitolerans]
MKTTLLTPNLSNHLGKMKALLFIFLFSFVLLGCKEDDVDPDLTKDFVGTWKGVVKQEKGYEYSSDWEITKASENAVKVVSTYRFVSKDPKYTSQTVVTPIENITLSTTLANSVVLNLTDEETVPGDVLMIKGVGIVSGKTLTFSSTATSKKTGRVETPPVQIFTKQ